MIIRYVARAPRACSRNGFKFYPPSRFTSAHVEQENVGQYPLLIFEYEMLCGADSTKRRMLGAVPPWFRYTLLVAPPLITVRSTSPWSEQSVPRGSWRLRCECWRGKGKGERGVNQHETILAPLAKGPPAHQPGLSPSPATTGQARMRRTARASQTQRPQRRRDGAALSRGAAHTVHICQRSAY